MSFLLLEDGVSYLLLEDGVSRIILETSTLLPSSTALVSSINPVSPGQVTTLTATVSGSGTVPTGTVQFFDGGVSFASGTLDGSGNVSVSFSSFIIGNHSLTASYAGDATYSPSTSPPLIETVLKANTTTTLVSNANPIIAGQSAIFTATVTPVGGIPVPTGTVQFFDGVTLLGTNTLGGAGTTTFTFTSPPGIVGANSITATYLGDANCNPSTTIIALIETVLPASPLISSPDGPRNYAYFSSPDDWYLVQ